ncbi:hypothetical protein [Rhodococcus sp. 1168]|uniref:hypothetical protein n=1 Tax=Rhodococcus sp. 1168 TaxID=2018041 RepID=UPI000F738144|nr:hypothetical protein [Rhodococcus sp. 1168]
MVSVQGSTPEGNDDHLVFIDDLPGLRIEDAPNVVWTEAKTFYGERAFGLMGAFDGTGGSGYRFSASPADS